MRRLPTLPPALTSLAFGLLCNRLEDVSAICQLQELQELHLSHVGLLQPQRLSQLTRLTALKATELATPDADGLVAALAHLHHLRHLELRRVTGGGGGPDVDVQALEHALRQLLQLTALELVGSGCVGRDTRACSAADRSGRHMHVFAACAT